MVERDVGALPDACLAGRKICHLDLCHYVPAHVFLLRRLLSDYGEWLLLITVFPCFSRPRESEEWSSGSHLSCWGLRLLLVFILLLVIFELYTALLRTYS